MSPTISNQESDDGKGLARLAEKLVQRLGVDDALKVCRENSWHGVLNIIESRQNDGMYI